MPCLPTENVYIHRQFIGNDYTGGYQKLNILLNEKAVIFN